MKRKDILLLLSLLMMLLGVHGVQAQDTSDLLNRINTLRAAHGLPPYSVNGALTAAAQQQAQWIVDNGSVVHTHPDGSGPRTRALANGYGSPDVGENIYGGTMATNNDAWIFWLNSPIHYQGMINSYYTEIGVGIASGAWGQAFVTDFGNPTGSRGVQVVSNTSGKGNNAAAPPPSYVVGIDEHGNIKHQVQAGETVGDIALLYGYTWADLPYMLKINGLDDVHDLSADSIFLVPPKAGTYTPTPGGPPDGATESATAEETGNDDATAKPTKTPKATHTPAPLASSTMLHVATAAAAPQSLLVGVATESAPEATAALLVAAVPTIANGTPGAGTAALAAVTIVRSGPSPWLGVAVIVQVGVLLAAGFEFFRRRSKRR